LRRFADSVKQGERQKLEEDRNREELEALLKRMFETGQLDPHELAKIAGVGLDPSVLGQMFEQVKAMMSDSSGPVNWDLATKTASDLANKGSVATRTALETEVQNAFDMARLWLGQVTEFQNSQASKNLSRGLWVQDAIPLFRELSEPVAAGMAKAISENLQAVMPEELSGMAAPAAKFLKNAGAAMFAMQLGQAIGKLSQSVLTNSEVGIPLSTRPGFVLQNLDEFLSGLETSKSEMLIFLATRELALSALYASNKWLREQLIAQVREFAAGLRIDTDSVQDLASQVDPNDPSTFNIVIESGALITPRTEEQELALVRIETMLALVEGWADAVAQKAAERLPNINQLAELLRRHQAVGASQKTFATLLGLELKPRLQREAMAMWKAVGSELSDGAVDELWKHPDQLPSSEEIKDPQLLIQRLHGGGDDFDAELRKLLGH
jgi:putative hydrolase